MTADGQLPGWRTSASSSVTSTSLLERVKANDRDAWRRFVDIYAPLVYQWCRRWGVANDDVGDIAQEVFRAVATSVMRFRHDDRDATFRGWLWTIARNKARDHFARGEKRPRAVGGSELQARLLEIPEDCSEADSGPYVAGELTQLIGRALNVIRGDFQERTWQAFWRTAVGGESTAAVAHVLGMTNQAVRLAKNRVLRRLREEFRDLISLSTTRPQGSSFSGEGGLEPNL